MNFQRRLSLCAVLILIAGCQNSVETTKSENAATEPTSHAHGTGDELVWEAKESLGESGVEIWLGHHGSHFHAGDTIEPSVAIMKDGKAFADAKVFNQLVDPKDANKTITEEIATVYEPETDEEIAHYAQGDLVIPTGSNACLIRFRIEIPEMESLTRDTKVKIGH